jgi:hypothetical protein
MQAAEQLWTMKDQNVCGVRAFVAAGGAVAVVAVDVPWTCV